MKAMLDDFVGQSKSKGFDNDAPHGVAWDPAMLVIDALRAIGPDATADQLRAWIAGQSAYVGITGTYNFRDGNMHGVTVKDVVMMRWYPAGTAFSPVSKFGGIP